MPGILLIGDSGVGKSTLANMLRNPISYIDTFLLKKQREWKASQNEIYASESTTKEKYTIYEHVFNAHSYATYGDSLTKNKTTLDNINVALFIISLGPMSRSMLSLLELELTSLTNKNMPVYLVITKIDFYTEDVVSRFVNEIANLIKIPKSDMFPIRVLSPDLSEEWTQHMLISMPLGHEGIFPLLDKVFAHFPQSNQYKAMLTEWKTLHETMLLPQSHYQNLCPEAEQGHWEMVEQLARKDNPGALLALGLRQERGDGIPVNHYRALYYFQRVLEIGDNRAQALITSLATRLQSLDTPKTFQGYQLAHFVTRFGQPNDITIAISAQDIAGIEVTADEETLLHIATRYNPATLATLLDEKCCLTDKRNHQGYTALQLAILLGKKEALHVWCKRSNNLLALCQQQGLFHLAAQVGHTSTLRQLLDFLLQSNHSKKTLVKLLQALNSQCLTPLALTRIYAQFDTMKYLLEFGVDIDSALPPTLSAEADEPDEKSILSLSTAFIPPLPVTQHAEQTMIHVKDVAQQILSNVFFTELKKKRVNLFSETLKKQATWDKLYRQLEKLLCQHPTFVLAVNQPIYSQHADKLREKLLQVLCNQIIMPQEHLKDPESPQAQSVLNRLISHIYMPSKIVLSSTASEKTENLYTQALTKKHNQLAALQSLAEELIHDSLIYEALKIHSQKKGDSKSLTVNAKSTLTQLRKEAVDTLLAQPEFKQVLAWDNAKHLTFQQSFSAFLQGLDTSVFEGNNYTSGRNYSLQRQQQIKQFICQQFTQNPLPVLNQSSGYSNPQQRVSAFFGQSSASSTSLSTSPSQDERRRNFCIRFSKVFTQLINACEAIKNGFATRKLTAQEEKAAVGAELAMYIPPIAVDIHFIPIKLEVGKIVAGGFKLWGYICKFRDEARIERLATFFDNLPPKEKADAINIAAHIIYDRYQAQLDCLKENNEYGVERAATFTAFCVLNYIVGEKGCCIEDEPNRWEKITHWFTSLLDTAPPELVTTYSSEQVGIYNGIVVCPQ